MREAPKPTNPKVDNAYYIWLGAGILAMLIFALTCIRPIQRIGFSDGFLPFLYDGTIQHKIGELFLWIPFFYIGLNTFSKNRAELNALIERYRWSMMFGGFLNLVAWFSLKDVMWWHPFCWVVFFWGLFAVPLCRFLFLERLR